MASQRLKALLLPRLREHHKHADRRSGRCIIDVLLAGGLSEGAVLYNAVQILGAGHDTTATTLAMLLWQLAQNIELQETVREELRGMPEAEGSSPLLSACIKEVLRLWPAAGISDRYGCQHRPQLRVRRLHCTADEFECNRMKLTVLKVVHVAFFLFCNGHAMQYAAS